MGWFHTVALPRTYAAMVQRYGDSKVIPRYQLDLSVL